MIAWFAIIAALGVFAAIPIKRQLINKEALPFPTGTATAETIRTIHTTGGGDRRERRQGPRARRPDRRAGHAGARSAGSWSRARSRSPGSILGHGLASWTIALKTEVVLIGAGALMSFRTGWSLLLGGFITYW